MSERWTRLMAPFPDASPELVVRRALRRRADCKFVVTEADAEELLRVITQDYAVLSAGAERVASYRTLYYDTAELDFFHAHRRGQRVRHKVRVRHYPDRRVSFLEVKTRRSELESTKLRCERVYGESALSPDDQAFVGAHTGNAGVVLAQVWTDFRRLTLFGLHTQERVTIDLDLGVGLEQCTSLGALAVVEVKQWPFRRDTPVMAALRAAGLRPGWMSKYCTAVAMTRPGVRLHRLRPGLRALERVAA